MPCVSLANTSARVAIKRSARLQARNIQLKGMIRLVYALGALSCGGVCYMFLTGFLIYLAPAMTGIVGDHLCSRGDATIPRS